MPEVQEIIHRRMLGRRPRRQDPRVLRLARYINVSQIPEPPQVILNSRGITDWQMLGNDYVGDCTIAGIAHGVQVAVLSEVDVGVKAAPLPFEAKDVVGYYSKWCGYVPGDSDTDQGGVEIDVLTKFRNEGFLGHKIKAFVSTDPGDLHMLALAHWLFGGVYNGLSLPEAWQSAKVWDLGKGAGYAPGSWGGHCTFSADLDCRQKTLGLLTWGTVQICTPRAFAIFCDEGYALIFEDWKPPKGFDLDLLEHDLAWVEKQPRTQAAAG